MRPKKEQKHAFFMYKYYVSGMRGCFEWSFMQSLLRLPFSLLLLSFHFRSPTFPFRCRQKSLSLAKWSPFAYPDLSSPPFSSILANLPSWIPPSRKGASCRYVSVYAFIPLHPSRPLALRFLSQGSKRRAGIRLESSEAPHSLRQTTFPLPPLLPSSPSPPPPAGGRRRPRRRFHARDHPCSRPAFGSF